MIFAGIDVNIITHEKALLAGIEALGLWTWGMCYAQLHETNGRLPRVAVLSALGGRRNIMLAAKLVAAGLWVLNDDGSWSIWNYGKKNQTAEEIRAKRDAAADRVRRWRERRNASGNASVTPLERVRTGPPPEPSPSPDNTTRKQEGESARPLVTPVVVIDEALRGWAGIAGAPEPTQDHLAEFQLDAQKHGKVFADPVAAFKSWLLKQKRFDSDRRARASSAPRQAIGAAANAPWMNPTNFDFKDPK